MREAWKLARPKLGPMGCRWGMALFGIFSNSILVQITASLYHEDVRMTVHVVQYPRTESRQHSVSEISNIIQEALDLK